MKGIIAKDLMTGRKTIALYLLVLICFAIGGGENGMMVAMLYSIMLPINLIAYDERSRFERLAPMMPISSMDCVLTKYVFAYGFMALVALMSGIRGAVLDGAFIFSSMLVLGMAMGLFAQALTLPLIFRFGVEKGRTIYLVAIMALALLMGGLGSLIESQTIIPQHLMGVLAFAAALAINIGSIFISAKAYEKRLTA